MPNLQPHFRIPDPENRWIREVGHKPCNTAAQIQWGARDNLWMVCHACGIAIQITREFQLPSDFGLCTEMPTAKPMKTTLSVSAYPLPPLTDVYSDLLPPRPNDDMGHNDSSWVSANERRRLAMEQGGVRGYIKEAELQLGRDVQVYPPLKVSTAERGDASPHRAAYWWA